MNIVSDPPDETPEQQKARLLRCPKLKASVCKVARGQGVLPAQEEDVYQETMIRMSAATLPRNDAEARRYIHGIAKNYAIDYLRTMNEEAPTRSLESLKDNEHPVRERIEQRAHMQGIFRQGLAKFGAKWDWFVRNRIHRETSDEIGQEAGVMPSHVRHEVSVMSRWFDGVWGKRTGSIGGVLALLLAIGVGWKLTHLPVDDAELTRFSEQRTDTRVVGMDAEALRARGAKACDAGSWSACEEDLEAAAALDPKGETLELLGMKLRAHAKQMRHDSDVKDGSEMNAKPGN